MRSELFSMGMGVRVMQRCETGFWVSMMRRMRDRVFSGMVQMVFKDTFSILA
jgi:hypothetical protein